MLLRLLLPLLFKGILCPGPSPEGKGNPGGKIPEVGHSRVEKGSGEDLGAGSNAPPGCPCNLHARPVLGNISLTPVSVSLSDFGEQKLDQGEGEMRICANFTCISLFLDGPFFSHPFTLSPLSFLCLSAGHVLGPHHLAGEEPLSFRMIQISSFANHSWENTQSSGWLGEVQTHRWDSDLGTIVYQLPWSRGNFSKEELENIHVLLQLYFHRFPLEVQAYSSQFQLECEFALPSGFLPEVPDQMKMVYGF